VTINEADRLYQCIGPEVFERRLAQEQGKGGKWLHLLPDLTPAYLERYDCASPFRKHPDNIVKARVVLNGSAFHVDANGKRLD